MSRKPHPMHRQTGDQGQRFLVRAFGYPRPNEACDIGYCNELKSAIMMQQGISLAPSATSTWVIDRHNNQLVIWEGNPEDHVQTNTYQCDCGTNWTDNWSYGCDDECPVCGKDVSPIESQDDPDCQCLMCKTGREYPDAQSSC